MEELRSMMGAAKSTEVGIQGPDSSQVLSPGDCVILSSPGSVNEGGGCLHNP